MMDEKRNIETKKDCPQQHRRRLSGAVFGVAALVLIVAAAFVTVTYYRGLDRMLFQERQSHLIEIAGKVSRIIDSEVDSARDKVFTCQQLVQRARLDSRQQLPAVLEDITGYIEAESAILLAFDQNAAFYASDGHTGYWDDTGLFLAASPERQSVITGLPYLDSDTSFMAFFNRLDTPVPIGGTDNQITHIALAVDLEALNKRLAVQGFGGSSCTYIINRTGRRLYQDRSAEGFIAGFNILSAMEQYPFRHGGSIEALRQAVQGGSEAGFEFAYGDINYFVSVSHLVAEEWEVLLFVPSAVLGENTDILLAQTIRYFTTIAVFALLLFGMVIITAMTSRNDKRMLRQQEAANIRLAEAAELAQSASIAKSEFLSRMSHDIRTPINGIMGMTEIALRNSGDEARVKDCLGKVEGSARHLLELVNDVLDMSRIESGKTKANHEPMCLPDALESCVATIAGQLSRQDLTLVREFEVFPHPRLIGDELHLRQVFINILGNALKFTPDGGRIIFRARELSAGEGQARFRFEIEDSGIGMSPEFLGHIFEPFSQENGGSRTTYKGTGLGMAITKQFVELMRGTIEVESTPGVGSRFIMEIPFEIDGTAPASENVYGVKTVLKGVKVLLVEDNELNMEIAQYLLEEEGVEVTTAENGRLAVEAFADCPAGTFDAILMDVMMPVMNGLEAARAIRALARPDAQSIPIIAMTANAYAEDVQKAKDAGMDAHLAKPIDGDLLFETLGRFTRAGGGNRRPAE